MILLTKLVIQGELLPVAVAHHTGFKKLAFNTDRQSFAELHATQCINPLWHAGRIQFDQKSRGNTTTDSLFLLTVSESPPKGGPIALHQLSTNDTSYIPCVEVSTKIEGPVAELACLGGRTRTHPVCTTDHCGFSPLATFPRQLVQSDALKDPTCTSGSHLYSETLASCGGVAPLLLESTKIKNKESLTSNETKSKCEQIKTSTPSKTNVVL